MKKITFFVSMLMLFFLSACAAEPAPVHCITPEDFCIGLVTDLGKIDDHALNEMTWNGLKKAEEKLGFHVQYIETIDSRDYEKNIETFARSSYDMIVTVGYNQSKVTLAEAEKYPEIYFIGVDQTLEPDKSLPHNLIGIAYNEDELGFLAGVLAAQMTKTNKVGAVCGPDFISPQWRYCEGFKAGVDYINFPPTPTPDDTGTPTTTPTAGTPPAESPLETPALGTPTQGTPKPPRRNTPTATPLPNNNHQGYVARKPFALKQQRQEVTPDPNAVPTSGEPTLEATPPLSDGSTPGTLSETGTETPTPEPTTVIEAVTSYHNEIGFKDSVNDPKWDAEAAIKLIDDGVDVVFGADSYGLENGAASATAKRFKYAIGVNTDQYFALPEARNMLVSSIIKRVDVDIFELLKIIKPGNFPAGNFTGTASYAPFHDVDNRIPAAIRAKLAQIQQDLANGLIETKVLWRKP